MSLNPFHRLGSPPILKTGMAFNQVKSFAAGSESSLSGWQNIWREDINHHHLTFLFRRIDSGF
jgi:hypothetical protein